MPIKKYESRQKEVSCECKNCGMTLVVTCPEPVLVNTPFMTAVFIERPNAEKCLGCGSVYMLIMQMDGEITFGLQLLSDGNILTIQ